LSLKHSMIFCRMKTIIFLIGEATQARRIKYASSLSQYFDSENKAVVLLKCPDGDYRFDFINDGGTYKLAFMECITLPVFNLNKLPYIDFIPLPEKENEIRYEKAVSKTVWYYCKFKELLGRDEAVKIFLDGNGEFIGARSWVPFYSDRMVFVAYAAWIESRINGENISLDEFSESKSIIRFIGHLWRKMYDMTGHLKLQIEYEEYIELFEAIWNDRAKSSGWQIEFLYDGEDTVLIFTKGSESL